MENKNIETLSPKIDVIFQALFGEKGSERITKGFLEKILNKKIDKIDLDKNPILRKEFKDDKLGVLDILAELEGKEKCNIEMQIVDKSNIIDRVLFYWSRLYSKQIQSGDDYKLLQKTIVILITDFNIKNLEELNYHSTWKIMETKSTKKIILTNKLEIDIIELPKIEGKEEVEDELLDWLYFLENPKSERVTENMKKNKELKEAGEKLDSLSADERMQRIAELRQKAIMDEKATYDKGLEDGEERGRKIGEERGKKIGEEKERIKMTTEIVKKMLDKNIDFDTLVSILGINEGEVEKITGLTRKKIEKKQKIAELRQKAIMDEKATYDKGLEDGEERGRKIGKKIGEKKEKIKIAKTLMELKVDIEIIAKSTGLIKEEIEKLRKE